MEMESNHPKPRQANTVCWHDNENKSSVCDVKWPSYECRPKFPPQSCLVCSCLILAVYLLFVLYRFRSLTTSFSLLLNTILNKPSLCSCCRPTNDFTFTIQRSIVDKKQCSTAWLTPTTKIQETCSGFTQLLRANHPRPKLCPISPGLKSPYKLSRQLSDPCCLATAAS